MSGQIVMVETLWAKPLEEVIEEARRIDTPWPVDDPVVRNRDFFAGKSLSEMAREQGVGPVTDISVFSGGIPEEEDMDELLDELYRMREP